MRSSRSVRSLRKALRSPINLRNSILTPIPAYCAINYNFGKFPVLDTPTAAPYLLGIGPRSGDGSVSVVLLRTAPLYIVPIEKDKPRLRVPTREPNQSIQIITRI